MAKQDAAARGFGVWLWEWVKSIGVALVVWFFLRTFLVEAFRIPSGSMENTLLVGDFLFVNKLLYGAEVPLVGTRLPAVREPRRGEILVFDSVEEEGLKVVKRLVGVPGDTLEMKESILHRNGQKVDEPFALHGNPSWLAEPEQRARMRAWQAPHLAGRAAEGYEPDLQNWGPIVVPPELTVLTWKTGPAAATDCADPGGYAVYRHAPRDLARAAAPVRVCVIGHDDAGNPTPPLDRVLE